ncbi:MAG: phosphoribosylformylglycinamidine synthase subunit PurQ, partial [Clostridia bacterium]|nr:phosphoribosylformylglycinamidine synthase subunit PurQ [Clostridia bacterium]
RVRNEKLCSAISLGMLPDISAADPYKGSYYAVTEALGRLVAAGFSQENSHIAIHVSHPYYKSNLIQNGHTFSAMLGLYDAQQKLETLSLCGDYSLGGLNDGATKPSVAVFGIGADIESRFHSSEFKEEGNKLVLFKPEMGKNGLPIPSLQLELFNKVERLFAEGIAVSAISLTGTSLAEGVMQMCFGTACRLGFDFDPDCKPEELYDTLYGAIAVELPHGADIPRGGISFGTVNSKGTVVIKSKGAKTDSEQGDVIIPISRLYELYRKKEAEIYERVSAENVDEITDARLVQQFNYSGNDLLRTPEQVKADRQIANQTEKYLNALHGNGEGEAPKPTKRRVATSQIMLFAPENRVNVVVPIFNGTIGDGLPIRYLTEKANPDRISVCPVRCGMDKQSIERLSEMIQNAGMLYLPDGTDSPLVIGAILKNEKIARAIQTLRKNCGLIYGSGSGFSALISAGLLGKDVPSGDYRDLENTEFTHPVNGEVISGGYISLSANPLSGLTRQSVLLRACSLRSPFMRFAEQGEIYRSELSSYKGRLIGESQLLTRAGAEGMIPTQFCDLNGEPSMHTEYNPCQAMMSIDSFTSFDGTVFGQISAPERALICKEPELKEFKALPVLESALAYLSE